jgi:hypothetical protein
MADSMIYLSQLLRDDFVKLLSAIPDSFFALGEESKQAGWNRMLRAARNGQRNPKELAKLCQHQEAL